MKYPIFAVLVAITIAGTLAGVSATAEPEKVGAPGIVNFSRIEGQTGFAGTIVGFGGATDSSAMHWLKNEGFASVINLRLTSEEGANIDNSRAAAQAVGLNYIHLPFDPSNPAPDVYENFIDAVADQANQPVYIHCGSATRAAALWMISRVLKDGWGIDAAREEVDVIALKPSAAVAIATKYINDLNVE